MVKEPNIALLVLPTRKLRAETSCTSRAGWRLLVAHSGITHTSRGPARLGELPSATGMHGHPRGEACRHLASPWTSVTRRLGGSTHGNRHKRNHRLMCSDTGVIYMSRILRNLSWQLRAMKSCCTRCIACDNWNYKQHRRTMLWKASVIYIWLTDFYRKDMHYAYNRNTQGRKQSLHISKQSRPWFNKQNRCWLQSAGNPNLCWFAAHA